VGARPASDITDASRGLLAARMLVKSGEDAESFVERVVGFDRDRLGEAARGHAPLIEESHASEQHEAAAVPAADEADLGCHCRYCGAVGSPGVQTQLDGLVARGDRSAADGVCGLTVVVLEIEVKLISEQVTGQDRISAGIDQPVKDGGAAISRGERDLHERTNTGCPSRVDCGSSRYG
jgi:hypothetical protein